MSVVWNSSAAELCSVGRLSRYDRRHILRNMIDPFSERRASTIVLRSRNGSTSYLARSMNVSWNEAFMLMERLQLRGLVTAPDKSGRRTVVHAAND